MVKEITRRSFLGAAAASAALLGASSLLSVQSPSAALADEAAEPDTVADAYGRDFAHKMKTDPIAPLDPPESWDGQADVIIVGTGGGLPAAARALDLGASVILIEKRPDIGGGSKEASAWVAPGTVVQEALGMPDISEAVLAAVLASAPFGSRWSEYTANTMESAKRLVKWTVDSGFAWQPTTVIGGPGPMAISPAGSEEGGMTARAMMSLYEFFGERFTSNGGDLRVKTELTGLVMEGGAVIGVQTTDWDGNVAYLKADKGVLLATGGMTANRKLLKKYVPTCYECAKFSTTGTQDTGEGILMGLGAGAEFCGFDAYDQFDGGINGVDWNTHMYAPAVQIARQPWLGVDINGERYPYLEGSAAQFTAAASTLNSLPGHQGYVFFDSKYEEYGPTFKQNMCRLLIDGDTMPDVGRMPASIVGHDWRDGVRQAIADGLIASGETIEEVAEKLGMAPEKAAAAVASWNEICAAGTDPEGKMPDKFLYPIEEGPFYGMAVGSFVFSTHAGLAVGPGSQVLDKQGNAIPGLFASGNTVGYPMAQANGACCFAAATANLAVETMAGISA